MNIIRPLIAYSQPPKVVEPTPHALNYPSVAAQPLTAIYPFAGYSHLYPSLADCLVDKQGSTVDFLLGQYRGIDAAKWFFTQAIGKYGASEKITVDGYAATHSAIGELKQSRILPINVL